jgi:alkylation response protein AidB-like acyl-CoA dehydrogenase
MDTPGVSVAKKLKKAGMNASDTAQLHFDGVRVPQRLEGHTRQVEGGAGVLSPPLMVAAMERL